MENKGEHSKPQAWPNIPKIMRDNNLTRMDVGFQKGGTFRADELQGDHFVCTIWGPGLGRPSHSVTAYGSTPVVAAVHALNKVRRARGQKMTELLTSMQQAQLSPS